MMILLPWGWNPGEGWTVPSPFGRRVAELRIWVDGDSAYQEKITNSVRLSKQLFHGAHRQEEPSLDSGEFEKSILPIKRECCSVLRVDDNACGSHFPAVL